MRPQHAGKPLPRSGLVAMQQLVQQLLAHILAIAMTAAATCAVRICCVHALRMPRGMHISLRERMCVGQRRRLHGRSVVRIARVPMRGVHVVAEGL